ncbi:hypothetical protein ABTE87_20170, partial [Acinetobacter baumannii]
GIRGTQASLSLGRQFDNWGTLEAGVSRGFGKVEVLLPVESGQDAVSYFDTTQFVHFSYDTLDSLAFPTRGQLLNASWERSKTRGSTETSQ